MFAGPCFCRRTDSSYGVRDVRGGGDPPQNKAIQRRQRRAEGPLDVDHQNDTLPIRLVPHLMSARVVKDEAPALFPSPGFASDRNPAETRRPRDPHAKMIAEQSLVKTPMRRDVLSGRKDGKDGATHSRNGFHELRGLRTSEAVAFDFVPVAVQEKPLPFGTPGHRFSICSQIAVFGYVLDIWNAILFQHHPIEFVPDCRPVRFNSGDPTKGRVLPKSLVGISREQSDQLVHEPPNEPKHVVVFSRDRLK